MAKYSMAYYTTLNFTEIFYFIEGRFPPEQRLSAFAVFVSLLDRSLKSSYDALQAGYPSHWGRGGVVYSISDLVTDSFCSVETTRAVLFRLAGADSFCSDETIRAARLGILGHEEEKAEDRWYSESEDDVARYIDLYEVIPYEDFVGDPLPPGEPLTSYPLKSVRIPKSSPGFRLLRRLRRPGSI